MSYNRYWLRDDLSLNLYFIFFSFQESIIATGETWSDSRRTANPPGAREWSRRFPPPPWRSRPRPPQVRRRWPRPWPLPPLPLLLLLGQLVWLIWPQILLLRNITLTLLSPLTQLLPLNNNNKLSKLKLLITQPLLQSQPEITRQLLWPLTRRSRQQWTVERDEWVAVIVETTIPVPAIRGWKIVVICHRVWTLSIRPQGRKR